MKEFSSMAEAKLVTKIKGLGQIIDCCASFPEQLKALRAMGAEYPISLRDCAYMRLHGGQQDITRICHAPIYAKDSLIILAMISPLVKDLGMADQATKAHKRREYFVTLSTEVYDKYAEFAETDKNKKPEERRAIILPERKTFVIQKGSEIAQVLFQDVEKQYFDKFVSGGIAFYPINVSVIDAQKGTVINYLLFGRPESGSWLYGHYYDLCFEDKAFGVVKEDSAAGLREILSLAIAVSDLRKAEEELNKLKKFLQPEQIRNLESLIAKLNQ